MTIVGIGSVRGGPGVTTTALLIAGALEAPAAVVEADLAGGALAVRYGLGREPGLTTLAAAGAIDGDGWKAHAQDAGGVPVIVGPDSPDHTRALWDRAGRRIASALTASEVTWVADLGRVGDDTPLADDLALLLVVVRPVAEHLVTLSHRLPALRRRSPNIAVVLSGRGAYSPADVAAPLGVEVVGVIPHDERAADAMSGTGHLRSLARSGLFRSTTAIAHALDSTLAHGLLAPAGAHR